jgi:hypothetical protein
MPAGMPAVEQVIILLAALASLAACGSIFPGRTALLCTSPGGSAFRSVLVPASDFATYTPVGGLETSILRMERRPGVVALRNGYGDVVVFDRDLRLATADGRGFSCADDPSPPQPPPPQRRS